ncbi:f-box domain-containing protein [Gigaspora margarita]|uniref:F-box domain-containing protein n=1 Tax=Gigaspora margarita TaxID=4874 RepID=A0A8H4AXM4_GIGMA|nr:f-box domain-containing protein [Gigaspora margarita]
MITIPNECYYIIFNNLQSDYKNLFSCALVNRHWCRIIIPILWSDSKLPFKDIRLIEIFILALNVQEQALLIPFKIILPSHPKPLFEYTNYITSINGDIYDGIRNWFHFGGYETKWLENSIKCSLIAMFLRTSKKLKFICLDELICNQIISENLSENTTITSINLKYISNDFKSEF